MKTKLDMSKAILSMLSREFNLSGESVKERTRASKVVYTLESAGMKLGYGFGFYINGPYSLDLYDDLREIAFCSEYNETKDKRKWNFSKGTWERIREIDKKFIKGRDLRNLELMTSMHFLHATWRNNEDDNEMKKLFRKKHKNETFGDDSLISEEELGRGLIDSYALIGYREYYDKADGLKKE